MKSSQEKFYEQELRKQEIKQTSQTFQLVGVLALILIVVLAVIFA